MKKQIITFTIFAVAALFIIAGIILEQPHDVFIKAARICLECIGIG